MNWNWNYENYFKAILPLVLAVGRLPQGWIESSVLERSELSDVVGLAVVALLVFLVPNNKKVRKQPERDPQSPLSPKGEPR